MENGGGWSTNPPPQLPLDASGVVAACINKKMLTGNCSANPKSIILSVKKCYFLIYKLGKVYRKQG